MESGFQLKRRGGGDRSVWNVSTFVVKNHICSNQLICSIGHGDLDSRKHVPMCPEMESTVKILAGSNSQLDMGYID